VRRLLAVVVPALTACRVLDEHHCANLAGDATCRGQGAGLEYCNRCVAAHDGCVAAPPEPECGEEPTAAGTTEVADATTTTSSTGTSEPLDTTTTHAMDASTSSEASTDAGSTSSESSSDATTTAQTSDETTDATCQDTASSCRSDAECCSESCSALGVCL
jgi:hypothetical protein